MGFSLDKATVAYKATSQGNPHLSFIALKIYIYIQINATYFIKSPSSCYYLSITTKSSLPSGFTKSKYLSRYKLETSSQSDRAQIPVFRLINCVGFDWLLKVSVSFLSHSWNKDNNADNVNKTVSTPKSVFRIN